MECPSCKGRKTITGFITRTDGCAYGTIPCFECKGDGVVPDRPPEWETNGRKLRDARLERDWSQRELAKHLGITASALSQMEAGRLDPAPLADAYNQGRYFRPTEVPHA